MKPTDVTLEIAERWQAQILDAKRVDGDKEAVQIMIAAAFNAVVSAAEPITADRLLKIGWVQDPVNGECVISSAIVAIGIVPKKPLALFYKGKLSVYQNQSHYECNGDCIELRHTKTIGQLRALEIGLGITQ